MTDTLTKATLQADLTEAIRSKDRVRAATLRMALTAISTEEVAGDTARELSAEEVRRVITREAKKRREAAAAYTEAGRADLAETENAELAVLEGYLPQQLGDDELEVVVREALAEAGATSMAQMGPAMKAANAKVAGRAEGGRVAAVVKALLQQG